MIRWQEEPSILAVRLDNAGDVIMLEPALGTIKEAAPGSRITLLASPAGAAAAPLLPAINETITWRAMWQDVGGRMQFDPQREWEIIELLKSRRFDAALIFTSFSQTPHAPAYVCYLAGIPIRVGESKEFGGACLTTELRNLPDDLHQTERNLALVEALGLRVTDRQLAISIPPRKDRVENLLDEAGLDPRTPFVILHPGASAEARRYPASRFAAVAELLGEAGHQVLVTGVQREKDAISEVIARAPSSRAASLDIGITEFASLIQHASLVVCNNSLPLHLADALGTPMVVLYSGTDLESQWEPRKAPHRLLRRSTPCHPCYRFACPIGQPCLDIEPAEVIQAVEELLDHQEPAPRVAPVESPRTSVEISPRSLDLGPIPASTRVGEQIGRDQTDPARIAMFRALNLGDMLLAVPAFRALRQRFPRAEITLIGLPWARSFATRFSSYIDRFLEFPGFPGISEVEFMPARAEEFIQEQRDYGYDLALQMHGSGLTSNAFIRRLGANQSAGFHPDGRQDLRLDVTATYPEEDPEVWRSLRLAGLVGCRDLDPRLEFPLQASDLAEADAVLEPVSSPIVVIHPGARGVDRRWPPIRYAQLADHLARGFQAAIVLTGTEEEVSITADVASLVHEPVLDAAGRTSLGGLAGIISTANLFVGNDSGPAHLAEALATESIVLFGPEEPERWGPLDRARHRVIRRRSESGRWRVDAISLEDVVPVAEEMLAPQTSPRVVAEKEEMAWTA